LLSTADIIFTAATNIIGWRRGREALLKAELDAHNRLLDCSDAHAFSSSANKDRIGNCFTWIKADATFQGLHQALKEADGRIYVGEEPPKLASVRQNRTKYIKNISIARQLEDTIDEGWFNNELVFSHDLVAIIGNKGNGKSALTDIVALLGNANGTDFSFLNKERFRHPRSGKAALYSATLQWENGSSVTRSLAVDVSPHEVPLIKYIPQQFFERICNETGIGETSAFDQELKGVIFSHVSESDRLGLDSLERLISYRTEVVRERIQLLQSELSAINETIISLEHQIAPDQVAVWEHQIEQKQLEISAHKDGCPVEIDPPQDTSNLLHTLAKLQKTLDELQDKIDAESDFLKEEKRKLAAGENVRDRINNFRSEYRRLEEECLEDITLFGVALTEVIALSVNVTLLEQQLEVSRENIRRSSGKLDPNGMSSLITLQRTFKKQHEELSAQLADAEQTYSRYLRQLEDWKDLETALLGSVDTVGSLLYLERQFLDARTVLPQRLERERISRREKAVEIFSEVQRLVAIHRELYQPVQDFIASHDLTKERYNLHFQVQIVQHGFADRFLSMINQGMRGAYHGTEEGRIAVDNLLACHALNDESDLLAFLDEVMHSLQFDPATANQSMSVKRQLKKSTAPQLLYDFIFGLSYLQPKYELTLGGKSLNQLSPGERGVVLLIF